jgi:signal transduction histidine kinase
MLRQSEKMAQLGTMSAGMAHELNNPAAAAQRGAAQLEDSVSTMQQAQLKFVNLNLSADQFRQLTPLDQRAGEAAANPSDLDSLARSDREYELETWLDDAGFSEAWELAPSLATMNYTPDELSELAKQFSPDQLPAVLEWVVASYNVYSLLEEIKQGAGRISEIVKSLKTYVYLDQAPVQEMDVHEGIDNTLVLMRGKLKGGITVHRDYTENLPRIEAYGSELNQVWTNLIDNAADAMDGQGILTIRTGVEGNDVVVTIEDNGPGIPPEIVSKIFDPFFTTKPVGKGTGLGLNITYNIITQKHRGAISVTSEPGSTRFVVRLPIQPEAN